METEMYATQTLELHKFFSLSLGPGLLDFVLPKEKKNSWQRNTSAAPAFAFAAAAAAAAADAAADAHSQVFFHDASDILA